MNIPRTANAEHPQLASPVRPRRLGGATGISPGAVHAHMMRATAAADRDEAARAIIDIVVSLTGAVSAVHFTRDDRGELTATYPHEPHAHSSLAPSMETLRELADGACRQEHVYVRELSPAHYYFSIATPVLRHQSPPDALVALYLLSAKRSDTSILLHQLAAAHLTLWHACHGEPTQREESRRARFWPRLLAWIG